MKTTRLEWRQTREKELRPLFLPVPFSYLPLCNESDRLDKMRTTHPISVSCILERITRGWHLTRVPRRHSIQFEIVRELTRASDGSVSSVRYKYPEFDWEAVIDFKGVGVCHKGVKRDFPWLELPSFAEQIGHDGLVTSVKYVQPLNDLAEFPLSPQDPWAQFRAPASFGLMLWSAILACVAGVEVANDGLRN